MIAISCPHCLGRYLLRPGLAGPGGARIRCPNCEHTFAWRPDSRRTATLEPGAAGTRDPFAALDGTALREAQARGELFQSHGPALVRAYDAFRQGPEPAESARFRRALAERLGIDLPAWRDS